MRHSYVKVYTGRVALLLALLAGFWLRTHLLGAQELWGDEAMSTCIARLPLGQAMAPRMDTHPPLFYLLLLGWVRCAGWSLFALRFLPVALSLPAIALACALGRRLAGVRTGLVAAWVVALSPLQIYYAQESRMYSLVSVLGMASMLCLVRLLQVRVPRPGDWGVYWAVTLAAMYAHYQAFPLIAAQSVVVLVFWLRQRKRLLVWFGGMLGLAVAYLPWVIAQTRYLTGHSSGRRYALLPGRLVTIVGQGLATYVAGMTAPNTVAVAGTLLGLLIAGIGLLGLRRRPPALALLVAWLVASLGLWWLADPIMPFFHPRFVMAGAPALLLLVAAGLAWLAERTRASAAVLALVVAAVFAASLLGWYTDPAYRKGDYGQALAEIGTRAQPGDLILLNNREQMCLFDYYRPGQVPWALVTADETLRPERTDAALRRLTQGYSRVWLITFGYIEVFDPERYVEQWLTAHGYCAHYQSRQGFYVNLYLLGEPPPAPTVPLTARFEDGISLAGYDLRPQPVPTGGTLLVTLYWQADSPPQADYTVFAQLLDAGGTLVAQFDGQPANGARPTSGWRPDELVVDSRAIPLTDVAPGTYTLVAGLYTWPDLVRLRLAGGPGADALTISTVAVQ